MGTRAKRKRGKVVADRAGEVEAGRPGVLHLCVDKLGETTGEQDRPLNPEF